MHCAQQYGLLHEPNGLRTYMQHLPAGHRLHEASIEQLTALPSPIQNRIPQVSLAMIAPIAASCDAYVCDAEGNLQHLLEIKTVFPYALSNRDSGHYSWRQRIAPPRDVAAEHYVQVQIQMLVTGSSRADLLLMGPETCSLFQIPRHDELCCLILRLLKYLTLTYRPQQEQDIQRQQQSCPHLQVPVNFYQGGGVATIYRQFLVLLAEALSSLSVTSTWRTAMDGSILEKFWQNPPASHPLLPLHARLVAEVDSTYPGRKTCMTLCDFSTPNCNLILVGDGPILAGQWLQIGFKGLKSLPLQVHLRLPMPPCRRTSKLQERPPIATTQAWRGDLKQLQPSTAFANPTCWRG